MRSESAQKIPAERSASGDDDCVVFNNRVGEQLLAHGFDFGFSFSLVRAFDFEIEDLALTDRVDAFEIQAAERADNSFALRVENAVP